MDVHDSRQCGGTSASCSAGDNRYREKNAISDRNNSQKNWDQFKSVHDLVWVDKDGRLRGLGVNIARQ